VTSDGGTGPAGGIDPGMLRVLVREALREVLPGPVSGSGPASSSSPASRSAAASGSAPAQEGPVYTVRDGVGAVETVSVRTDAELAAFVTRLLHLFENPARRADLRAGRLRFRLAAAGAAGSARPSRRVEKGAVTEAVVRDAARAGARLVLGSGIGERVLVAQGSVAAAWFPGPPPPVGALIIGSIDPSPQAG
jgi:hypothetical protein